MCNCGRNGKLRRGMCGACYGRWLRAQPNTLRDTRTPVERFWSKVDKSGDCWLWTAAVNPNGYAQFSPNRRRVYAHRYAYELACGPIPNDLTVDHLCRVRHCVNPAHLEVVTRGENTRRGQTPRPCIHCGTSMVPANLSRHIAARHGEPA